METRQTVDFGIDLGTTNSAIACAVRGKAEIVKNRLDNNEITPSVVARGKNGQLSVGQAAVNKSSIEQAQKFKRLMGTSAVIRLSDGNDYAPEALSAEVLKELKANAKEKYGVDLKHVVITVPAMFQQPQCEATHRAAQLAGLEAVTLLQEPIAAATAYLGESTNEGDYLVYDLGGGTFDVSIVRLRDGEMSIVAHGGDNFLGGSDFDQAIRDWAKEQIKTRYGTFPELDKLPGSAVLMRECEEAKKRLSTQEQAAIDLSDLELEFSQITITQKQLLALIEGKIARTLALAHERIEQAGLDTDDLRGILLVGGPTKAPYLRDRLKAVFGIPLIFDEDPMTVVARGAALHASTLKKPTDGAAVVSSPNTATLDLFFDAVSPDAERTVSGKVLQPAGFVGDVRLERASGDWNSGWITLRNGAFQSEVVLSQNDPITDFNILLRDAKGSLQTVEPSTITLRMGNLSATPIAPYTYGVALEDGTMALVIEKNKPLPCAGTVRLTLTRAIAAGSNEEVIVYLLEGMSRLADDNIKVGELPIRGRDIERTLPQGEVIEVRLHMDESRLISARVSVPKFDLDWNVKGVQSLMDTPPVADLRRSAEQTEAILEQLAPLIAPEDEALFRDTQRRMEQIEADMLLVQESGAQNDPVAAPRLASNLAEVKAKLREPQQRYALEMIYRAALSAIDRAETIANDFENRLDAAAARDLRGEADRQNQLESVKDLTIIKERADTIFYRYYLLTHEYWIGCLAWLREQGPLVSDAKAFHECLNRAEERLSREDWEGTRLNASEAFKHLPDDEISDSRFAKAFLRQ